MTTDATGDWLKALRGALIADSQLAAAVGLDENDGVKVYVWPPANLPFPFVTIGNISFGDWSTSDTAGQEFRQDIEVWDSKPTGAHGESSSSAKARAIAARVYAICHREDLKYVPFAVPGRNLALVQAIGGRLQLEPDGITNRAVVTLRILIGN